VGDVVVLLGNGDGTMRFGSRFLADINPYVIRTGDVNNDGKSDVIIADSVLQGPGQTVGVIEVLTGNGDGTL
uniref:FG-GAP-like repeat-containing protein n=1 Tax=Acinetobacter baumannii TaxID=470 RepID=UPI001C085D33